MASSTQLAFLRHAPTAWNAEHRLQGQSDVPITAAAEDDVRRWRLPMQMRHWRRCCSPLSRARRTATLLRPAMPFAVVPALVEMSYGDWEGQTLVALRDAGGAAFGDLERQGLDLQPPGGESPRQVIERLRPWLASLAGAGAPTLAIAHKGVLRALLALATGWRMIDKPPLRLQSHALHLFAVDGDGTLRLQRINIAIGRSTQQAGSRS